MTRLFLIALIVIFSGNLFPQENENTVSQESSIGKSLNDSIFSSYTDEEFKMAVFKTIQKSSLTNEKLFLKTLKEVKNGELEKKEREYGVENISKEFSRGMNGWTITLSGMLVVFTGLVLILIVIHIFNFFFKEGAETVKVPAAQIKKETVPVQREEEIPEEHIIAIGTAVELYKRLYLINSMTSLTFKTAENNAWKAVNKFGQR